MNTTQAIKKCRNLRDDVMTFDNEEEFMKYYERNRETIDNMPTRGLNIRFKIPGFKLVRKNKELMFEECDKPSEQKYSELFEEIQDLRDRIDSLGNFMNIMNKNLKLLLEMHQDNQSQASYTSEAVDRYGRTLQSSYR